MQSAMVKLSRLYILFIFPHVLCLLLILSITHHSTVGWAPSLRWRASWRYSPCQKIMKMHALTLAVRMENWLTAVGFCCEVLCMQRSGDISRIECRHFDLIRRPLKPNLCRREKNFQVFTPENLKSLVYNVSHKKHYLVLLKQ